jgi:hypothetical protein
MAIIVASQSFRIKNKNEQRLTNSKYQIEIRK